MAYKKLIFGSICIIFISIGLNFVPKKPACAQYPRCGSLPLMYWCPARVKYASACKATQNDCGRMRCYCRSGTRCPHRCHIRHRCWHMRGTS